MRREQEWRRCEDESVRVEWESADSHTQVSVSRTDDH